jgi:zinc D-Ala-D-Ala carboxypeptidase
MTMTQHFTLDEFMRSEMALQRGLDNTLPSVLLGAARFTLAGAERVRAALGGRPMPLSSGYRCPALNLLVGGQKDSQHLRAEAIDFKCPTFGDPRRIVEGLIPLVAIIGIDQLILEGTWVHVSFTLTPRGNVFEAVNGSFRPYLG